MPRRTLAPDADTTDVEGNCGNAHLVHAGNAADLDQAIESLARLRTSYWLGNAGVTLRSLASLQRHLQHRLPDAVADARDQDYTWAEIGELPGLARAAVWNRYGRAGRKGHPTPIEPD